jgi:hypothetical protein
MGRNKLLAVFALGLVALAVWSISGPGVESEGGDSIVASRTALPSEVRRTDATLAPGPAALDPPLVAATGETRLAVPSEDTQPELVSLEVTALTTNRVPMVGVALSVFMSDGSSVQRWTSGTGKFTLLRVPVGELTMLSLGHELLFPTTDDPVLIKEDGELEVRFADANSISGYIQTATKDQGRVRLYKRSRAERDVPRWPDPYQSEADDGRGAIRLAEMIGQRPIPPGRTLPKRVSTSPDGELVASITNVTFPYYFSFQGLAPGEYQVIVSPEIQGAQARKFDLIGGSLIGEINLAGGIEALFRVRYASGRVPEHSRIKLSDTTGLQRLVNPERPLFSTNFATSTSELSHWTFSDVYPGTWYLRVLPGPRSIGLVFPVEIPTVAQVGPILDLVLDEPAPTTVKVTFNTGAAKQVSGGDMLGVILRTLDGDYLGQRSASSSALGSAGEGEAIEVNLGLLFPGEYEMFVHPGLEPGDLTADWEGAFEASSQRVVVPPGGDPVQVEFELDWYRTSMDQGPEWTQGYYIGEADW